MNKPYFAVHVDTNLLPRSSTLSEYVLFVSYSLFLKNSPLRFRNKVSRMIDRKLDLVVAPGRSDLGLLLSSSRTTGDFRFKQILEVEVQVPVGSM